MRNKAAHPEPDRPSSAFGESLHYRPNLHNTNQFHIHILPHTLKIALRGHLVPGIEQAWLAPSRLPASHQHDRRRDLIYLWIVTPSFYCRPSSCQCLFGDSHILVFHTPLRSMPWLTPMTSRRPRTTPGPLFHQRDGITNPSRLCGGVQ